MENRSWERDTYSVEMVDFDGDLKNFEVVRDEDAINTIYPNTIENMEQIIEDLDNGDCVDGWEDGQGNTIDIT